MVFYETFFLISNRTTNKRFYALSSDIIKAVTSNEGAVIKISDLGWRATAYPIIKPRVGKFYVGRWFHVLWGAKPPAVKSIQDVMLQNTGVLRFMTTRVRSPSKLYRSRSSFFLTPEAYQQRSNAEVRQGPVDFSI
jgi:ribosomal protein S6